MRDSQGFGFWTPGSREDRWRRVGDSPTFRMRLGRGVDGAARRGLHALPPGCDWDAGWMGRRAVDCQPYH
jgi:hypothetical protein